MIRANKPFAALMPLATINQVDRISKEGIDKDVRTARQKMSTVISTALGYGWLFNHPGGDTRQAIGSLIFLAPNKEKLAPNFF